MIKFSCPKCGAVYETDDSFNGRKVICGECETKFNVAAEPPAIKAKPAEVDHGPSTYITCPHCWKRFVCSPLPTPRCCARAPCR